MQPRQTPKWLELFITAFGPNGLVALAWWMGALHADRIRGAQRSYPFLEVTGAAGCGRSSLLSVLWKLIGTEPHTINLENSTPVFIQRRMYNAVNLPVVIEDPARQAMADDPDDASFDWDSLKTAYNGDAIGFHRAGSPVEQVKFRGALMITANPPLSEAMRSRFVFIELNRAQHTEESAQALRTLLDLHSTGDIDFHDTVKAAGERLEGLMQHMTAAYVISEPHLNKRVTFNHAQLHALLGVLDDLFVLPTDAREDAHLEIAAMTLSTD